MRSRLTRRVIFVVLLLSVTVVTDQPWPWEEPYYERARWDAVSKTWIPLPPVTELESIARWVGEKSGWR